MYRGLCGNHVDSMGRKWHKFEAFTTCRQAFILTPTPTPYALPTPYPLPPTLLQASEYIPVYNVKAMHFHLQSQLSQKLNENKALPQLPSTLMMIMLLRGKRDAILAIAGHATSPTTFHGRYR